MLNRIEREFEISRGRMMKIMEDFHRQMCEGLAGKKSSLKMIPSYAMAPTGKEKGRFVALDLGGTNFRVLELTLKGDRAMTGAKMMKFALDEIHKTGSAGLFFDLLAGSVKRFLKEYKLYGAAPVDMGFTFSFPVRQTGIAGGTLILWTKGFDVKGVVGKDVVGLLRRALLEKGIKNITITALVNDTVGTLVAKSYEDSKCDIGVIIGTGTNACYLETGTIINIEWGNFNKLVRTSFDRRLDEMSDNPGEQMLEKMVSGKYLGEIVRLILRGMIGGKDFNAEYMSVIEGDNTPDLKITRQLLEGLGLSGSSLAARRVIKKVCGIVSRRSARICASCIAAIVTRIDPRLLKTHTIAVDGSVFEKHPTFSRNMKEALKTILAGKSGRVKLVLVKDGSGKGAAISAAVAAKR